MNTTEIISFLTDNPGATAKEIGVKPVEMTRLFDKGEVTKVGLRKTGGRGRPSVEWAVAGADAPVRDKAEPISLLHKLPLITGSARAALDRELLPQIEYIEKQFDLGRSPVELLDRYKQIARLVERLAA